MKTIDYNEIRFTMVPNDLLSLVGDSLTPTDVIVYLTIASRTNNITHETTLSIRFIASTMGVTTRTVTYCLRRLEDAGVLGVINRQREDGGKLSNTYRLLAF